MDRPTEPTNLDPAAEGETLRVFLADRDAPCPGCGYNLRGLTTDVCPECRESLRMRVGLVEPKLGALLAALSGLLAGCGTGVMILGLVGYATLRFGGPSWDEIGPLLIVVVGGVIVEAVLALRLCSRSGRMWFRRRTHRVRARLAAGTWILTVALAALAIAVTGP